MLLLAAGRRDGLSDREGRASRAIVCVCVGNGNIFYNFKVISPHHVSQYIVIYPSLCPWIELTFIVQFEYLSAE